MGKYVPITKKVNSLIILSLVVGIGLSAIITSVVFYVGTNQINQRQLTDYSIAIENAIQNFMISGEANQAIRFFDDMGKNRTNTDLNLFKKNGTQAFTDLITIQDVNNRIAQTGMKFDRESRFIDDIETTEPQFSQAAENGETVFFNTFEDNTFFFRAYTPLINLPTRCASCHGRNHTIRGVIDIRRDISFVRLNQILASGATIILSILVLAFLSFAITRFMAREVILPVTSIGAVCNAVTDGDFTRKVEFTKNDEIGNLGETVNEMVRGLYERFELSKFVSSKTIQSIGSGSGAQKVPLTLFFSDIRGFTNYSESRDPQQVINVLNLILNTQTEMIQKSNGDIDKYVGDEIVAVFSDEQAELDACKTAYRIQTYMRKHIDDFDGLQVGIGIDCGQVILGPLGSEKRADYTVIGDHVNTASRLCDTAKPGQVIISEMVYARVKGHGAFEGPYKLKVKGKSANLKVYIIKSMNEV